MVKNELLNMRSLLATRKMLAIAKEDVPQKETYYSWGRQYTETRRKYSLFMRACAEDGILKVAIFWPDGMRVGGRLPIYEVYINPKARRFITYDPSRKKWLESKLDRLTWPGNTYLPSSGKIWMSPSDQKLVRECLLSETGGYDGILDFQRSIRKEELARRHKRQTDPWDADMALVPPLPKDWPRWVDKVGIPENYIFYQYEKRGAKTGYCTYCEKDVPLKSKPHHNKDGQCPCCHRKITYKALGRLGWRLDTKEVCVYLIQSRPDGFVVREFWADRRYLKEDYKNPKVSCVEHWRVIYDPALEARTYYWGSYKQLCVRWIAGYPSYSWMGSNSIYNSHGNQDGCVYGKTLPHLAKGFLKQTGLVDWIKAHGMVANPDTYMTVRRKEPAFEQIWKAGLSTLTKECWHNPSCLRGLVETERTSSLAKMLKLDKRGLSRLRQYDGGCFLLRWLQLEHKIGKPISDEVLTWYSQQKISTDDLKFICGKMTPLQARNYLLRQAETEKDSVQQVLNTWRDYLSMAEKLGLDTSDEIVYRVKLLRQRHDELVVRLRHRDSKEVAKEVLEQFPKVDETCQAIREKFEYANDKYAIVVPTGVLDIIVEGEFLNHCVGSSDRYWDRIERNEAYILFLRRAATPHLPYYTLEAEPDGSVRQKRTSFDRQSDDIQDVMTFLKEWQGVVAKRLTAEDRKSAQKSRVLREQEFDQMRKDKVVIHAGDLNGRLLVDVLTADLMENKAA